MAPQRKHHLKLDCFSCQRDKLLFTKEQSGLLGILFLWFFFFFHSLQIDKNMLGESRTLQSNRAFKGELGFMEAWLCIDQRAMDDSCEWEEQITPWATVSRLHPSWWERPARCGTPQPAAAHFLTETAVWALQSWPRWWMASTAGERKEKGAWEPSEDQYVRTGEPASHVKNPNPAPSPPAPLPARSAVSCITDGQASGSGWAGNWGWGGRTLVCVSVCMCGRMCIYMKCVSRFLEGLACQQTQGRRGTHGRGTCTLAQLCKIHPLLIFWKGPHCDMVIQRCLRRWISY